LKNDDFEAILKEKKRENRIKEILKGINIKK